MITRIVAAALAVLLISSAGVASDLDALLAKGPVVVVENNSAGKFDAATGIIAIDAPIQKVWNTIVDFKSYPSFVPKLVNAEVDGEGTNAVTVKWEIEVPGPNTKYSVLYKLDPAKHVIAADQVGGDLKGSHWSWWLESTGPNRTLVHYRSSARHFSSILESAEDDQQTITIGVNVGGVLTLLRALKDRVLKT